MDSRTLIELFDASLKYRKEGEPTPGTLPPIDIPSLRKTPPYRLGLIPINKINKKEKPDGVTLTAFVCQRSSIYLREFFPVYGQLEISTGKDKPFSINQCFEGELADLFPQDYPLYRRHIEPPVEEHHQYSYIAPIAPILDREMPILVIQYHKGINLFLKVEGSRMGILVWTDASNQQSELLTAYATSANTHWSFAIDLDPTSSLPKISSASNQPNNPLPA